MNLIDEVRESNMIYMENLGIISQLPYMAPMFCLGTRNGEDCRSCGGRKIYIRFDDVTSKIEGCDRDASKIRDVDIELMLLISSTVGQREGVPGGLALQPPS